LEVGKLLALLFTELVLQLAAHGTFA